MYRLICYLVSILLLLCEGLQAAQYSINIVTNPTPVSLSGINNAGQVVGSAYRSGTFLDAFYWPAPGQGQDLGTMGCAYEDDDECFSKAYDINDQAITVGEGHSNFSYAYLPVAFRWENGVMAPLKTVGVEYTKSLAVNNSGTITGFGRATYNYTYVSQAYIHFDDQQTLGLWATQPGLASFAYGINDDNAVAGCYSPGGYDLAPGYWKDTGNRQYPFTPLPSPGAQACVEDINDQNVMVGYATNSSGARLAALWENDQFTDLGTIGVNQTYSYANAVNHAGQVVGHYRSWERLCLPTCRTRSYLRAFIWENGTMTALNDLVVDSGVFVKDAFDINELGQIVAMGQVNDETVFMILTPLP